MRTGTSEVSHGRGAAGWLWVLPAIAAIAGGSVRGDVILGNGVDPPYMYDGTVFNDQRTLKGVGLEMSPGPTYSFERFSVVLENISGQPEATGHIYAHDGSIRPGAELLRLNTVTVNQGEGVYDFIPSSPFALVGGQKYWFVVSDGPATGWFRWDRTDPAPAPSGGAGVFLGYTFSEDGGASWTSSNVFCALEIHGIPEPATLSLLAIGGLALVRRRRS